ncbi:TPA: hypothetical protein HA235_00640 [Candidatus Woesearchaeota archaeon]|nr:hypothetical protein [Candidatus Woesearchaeota archaeon]HIH31191.1 hypothetical protein [Candidatus Woesearchaeota archaeon]HIH55542.1 hypothetical protein [Candidatus Woesearchaeota archaeon]HIJ01837.1 hypothetical protein [Candidatus Woesearchaeota archaeon]HIJ13130.1 hypothetical protein [Candidatus Woesearchaeota archaeon]
MVGLYDLMDKMYKLAEKNDSESVMQLNEVAIAINKQKYENNTKLYSEIDNTLVSIISSVSPAGSNYREELLKQAESQLKKLKPLIGGEE